MTDLLAIQRAFSPKIEGKVPDAPSVIVGGMGGSALPALALMPLFRRPTVLHRDYGLPERAPEDALYVAVSYSGETEETLSFFDTAYNRGHALAVITTGGTLRKKAETLGVPHVLIPKTELEPRDAFGLLSKALLTLLNEDAHVAELDAGVDVSESAVRELARVLMDRIPVVYASSANEAHAYLAKILLNETAKVPAFHNVFPEANHNEMQGIDPKGPTDLAKDLVPVLLMGPNDHSRVKKRMALFRELMDERGLETHALMLPEGRVASVVYAWLMFREASRMLAESYGIEPSPTPLIAEFKKRL